jgi:dTDP-4-dehydrorhamnose reductase
VKILLLGANGQVGREILDIVKDVDCDLEIVGLGRAQLDVTCEDAIQKSVDRISPSLVINAAAYTQVDNAEKEPDLAYKINRDGPENIAKACDQYGIPLIHISTDYVFDGEKKGGYLESDTVNPQSVYGDSKLEGERCVQHALDKHIILRTSWVFGVYGNNFVYTIIRLAKQREELRIVSDQFGCPTSAASIAAAIVKISRMILNGEDINWGIYNYCGSPETNWCDFARAIVEATKQHQDYGLKVIESISTSEYPTLAVRPRNSVLICNKIRNEFGISQQPWLEGLRQMIEHKSFASVSN